MAWLRIGLAVLITLVWALGYLLSYFKPGVVRAPVELTPVILAIVGWLLGGALKSVVNRNGKDRDGGFWGDIE